MMQILNLLPIGVKIGIAASMIAAAGLVYGVWHHSVYNSGYQACKAEQAEAVRKGEEIYEKTSIEVQRLSDVNLRNEFCKWVRDADLPTCLKDLPAFR